MNTLWDTKWKSALIWLSGYLDFIAFALVGGYVIVKSEDRALKKTAKKAFIVTLIFAAVSAFLTLFYNILLFAEGYRSSAAYDFYVICGQLQVIARVVVYAVFIGMELFKKEDPARPFR